MIAYLGISKSYLALTNLKSFKMLHALLNSKRSDKFKQQLFSNITKPSQSKNLSNVRHL